MICSKKIDICANNLHNYTYFYTQTIERCGNPSECLTLKILWSLRPCGFKSHYPHQKLTAESCGFCLFLCFFVFGNLFLLYFTLCKIFCTFLYKNTIFCTNFCTKYGTKKTPPHIGTVVRLRNFNMG